MIKKLICKLCKCNKQKFCPNFPDLKRKHRLGTRFINEYGRTFKYAKIDFGIIGHDKKKKPLKNVVYAWIMVRL